MELAFYFNDEAMGMERLSKLPAATQLPDERGNMQGWCTRKEGQWKAYVSGTPWTNRERGHVNRILEGVSDRKREIHSNEGQQNVPQKRK